MYSVDKLIHETHFIRKRPDGLKALTVSYLILQFAIGMAGSFGVLFVFHLGQNTFQGLTLTVAYLCLQRTVVALVMPIVAVVTSKIGYRRTMLLGLISMALKYLSLMAVGDMAMWLLIPALIFGGISIPAYYLGYHALFIDDNDDAKLGEQIGFMAMLGGMAGAISPILSGLIIDTFDFPVMFGIAMVLMLISAIPLLLMKHHKKHIGTYSLKKVRKFVSKHKNVFWANLAWHFENSFQGLFWGVYLYLILKSYTEFGAVGSVMAVMNSIAIYICGKLYDRRRAKKVFTNSAIVVSLAWIGRFLSTTPFSAIGFTALSRLFSPPWWMKIRRRELFIGEKTDSLVFSVAHEYVVTFSVIFGWVVGYLILLLTKEQWSWLILPIITGIFVSVRKMKSEQEVSY